MNSQDKLIGDIVLVGRAAYQLYSHTYRGEVEYRAEVGRPWRDRTTGVTRILPFMQDHSVRDFQEATTRAAEALEELRQSAFRQDTLKLSASVSPIAGVQSTTVNEQSVRPLELKLANS